MSVTWSMKVVERDPDEIEFAAAVDRLEAIDLPGTTMMITWSSRLVEIANAELGRRGSPNRFLRLVQLSGFVSDVHLTETD